MLDAFYGEKSSHLEIGLDTTDHTSPYLFSGFYLSQTQIDDQQKMERTALGFRALAFELDADSPYGADIRLAISHTDSDRYERTGILLGASVIYRISPKTYFVLGDSASPQALSLDWDSDLLLENRFETGFDFRFQPNWGVYARYQDESTLMDDWGRKRNSQSVLFGLNAVF